MAGVEDDLRKLKQIIPKEKDFSDFVNLFRYGDQIGISEQNDETGQCYEVMNFGFLSPSESSTPAESFADGKRRKEWYASPYTKHTEITRTWYERLYNTMLYIIKSSKSKQVLNTKLLIYKEISWQIKSDRERVPKGIGDCYTLRKINLNYTGIGEMLEISVGDGGKNLDGIVSLVIKWMLDTTKRSLAPFSSVSDAEDSGVVSKEKGCTIC